MQYMNNQAELLNICQTQNFKQFRTFGVAMSFHKIKNVEALDNFTLQVLFESGEKRFYDLNKLIEVNKDFEILKRDKNLFKLVKIDIQGYGVYWNDYLDISCNEIYYNN